VEELLGKERALTDKATPFDANTKDSGAHVNSDVQGRIPVFVERDFGHVRIENVDGRKVRVRGGRVVYINGTDKFVPQGTWPMTERTQRILAELAQ
jgi:hypothetical protein